MSINEILNKFTQLIKLNLNEWIEQKEVGGQKLSYLTWAKAWEKFVEHYPDATYEIGKFVSENNTFVPFMLDANTGYMVSTKVTAGGLTHEMWLPVLDSNNKAMKPKPYTYKVKKYEYNKSTRKSTWNGEYEERIVNAATMFDINTAIMRCLVKNLAMFGLGLYIYAGEDLPQGDSAPQEEDTKAKKTPKVTNLSNTPLKATEIPLKEQIKACKTEEELRGIYKTNKKAIIADADLLKLVTDIGDSLRKVS